MPCRAGLAELIAENGPPQSLVAKEGSTFASLASSIVAQQLAIGAARTIFGRVLVACKVGAHAKALDITYEHVRADSIVAWELAIGARPHRLRPLPGGPQGGSLCR